MTDFSRCLRSAAILAVAGLLLLTLPRASGTGDVDFPFRRSFSDRAVLTNVPILATLCFTNNSTNLLRGFFFSDQIPAALSITPLSVRVNDRDLTNIVLEAGGIGDVYAGCTPYRWCFESPAAFGQSNPIPPAAAVEIKYSISSASNGTFYLQQYEWAACEIDRTNAFFRSAEQIDTRAIKFVNSSNIPLVEAAFSGGSATVRLDGVPGSIYELQFSSNLLDWTSVSTNLSPFIHQDSMSDPARFYRGILHLHDQPFISTNLTSTNTILVSVVGVSGCAYALEGSEDLSKWSLLVKDVSPFVYVDTNDVFETRFYRAYLLPP